MTRPSRALSVPFRETYLFRVGERATNRIGYWKIDHRSGGRPSGANSFKEPPQAPY